MQRFEGTVVQGKNEARKLGYPTANLAYDSDVAPTPGVWTCDVIFGSDELHGLAVVGMWELANGLPSLEVHILDFDYGIYGQRLTVELTDKLRDLIQFTDMDTLKKQIEKDVDAARKKLL
jgi:riboflavin kinase/FMN adenylyltransferase